MIFVTVGTGELPMDRLLREVDRLAAEGDTPGEFFCQTGFTDYVPGVPSAPMLAHGEWDAYVRDADVVVSQGGPGSVLPAVRSGKPLVLVPRLRRHGEAVDDHQLAFCRRLGETAGASVVEDIANLGAAIRAAYIEGPRDPLVDDLSEESIRQIGARIEELLARRGRAVISATR